MAAAGVVVAVVEKVAEVTNAAAAAVAAVAVAVAVPVVGTVAVTNADCTSVAVVQNQIFDEVLLQIGSHCIPFVVDAVLCVEVVLMKPKVGYYCTASDPASEELDFGKCYPVENFVFFRVLVVVAAASAAAVT